MSYKNKRVQSRFKKILASVQLILDVIEKVLLIFDKLKFNYPTIYQLCRITISLLIVILHVRNNS